MHTDHPAAEMRVTRRGFLLGTTALAASAAIPRADAQTAPHGPAGTTPSPPADVADVASLENLAQQAHTAFCWWRTDLSKQVSYDYWRDVHGPLAARVPGLYQYRQLQISPSRSDLWGRIDGIELDNRMDRQPDGMPQGLFLSAEHLKAFAQHPVVGTHIFNDERNFVRRLGTQMSPPGSANTLIDRVNIAQLQGAPPFPSFAVCFVAREGIEIEAFHRYVREQVALPWSGHEGVMRLRLQPLERYDENAWNSPGVDHTWPGGREYWAYVELAVRDLAVPAALAGSVLRRAEFRRHVATVHSYPIQAIYTIVQGGRPTDVGLRGYPAVQAIRAAGAANQRDPELLRFLYGDATLGIERLR